MNSVVMVNKDSQISKTITAFILLLGVWLLVMTVFAGQMAISTGKRWEEAIGYALHYWGPWLILSPAALILSEHIPLNRKNWLSSGSLHVLFSIGFAFLTQLMVLLVIGPLLPDSFRPGGDRPPGRMINSRENFHPFPPPRVGMDPLMHGQNNQPFPPMRASEDFGNRVFRGATSRMPVWIPLYWIIITAHTLFCSSRQLQQKQREALSLQNRLTQTQLDALKLQLQPHFLFNALNAISTLVHRDADKADAMIGNLSLLLRRVLELEDTHLVTLREEMALVNAYLDIERVRFGDRIQYEEYIDEDCWSIELPVMLLQPIFENAIRHGIEPLDEPGFIKITSTLSETMLNLSIEDNGVGRDVQSKGGTGIGLSNAAARLEGVFGKGRYSLLIEDRKEGGTIVSVSLPLGHS